MKIAPRRSTMDSEQVEMDSEQVENRVGCEV